ncbi:GNAT family N-acetyltransferase [Bacillus sp. FJAT-29814]|uniref:GNAT family N-acetyltransferase n=1 Tax=Bacillus sp. FJAT-29814 TaxID=1729688 RepID=UPI00082C7AF4|nr:GNAT family protein [Bacillus sp. FJAT-29814]
MINLRKLQLKDTDGMLEWMHDIELMKNFRFNGSQMTIEKVESFIAAAQNDILNKHYAVVAEEDEYLGTISLKNIDFENKNGEYAISMRKKAIGTGAAQEATKQLLTIAFGKLGLEKVYLNVLSENKRAIRFYEKMGFIKEGEFKKHVYVNGELQNLCWFAMFNGGIINGKI